MEEIPTRFVYSNENPEGYNKKYNWILQEGKTRKQILLEIREALDKCHNFQNLDDLLFEAEVLFLNEIQGPQSHQLYRDINKERRYLGLYVDRPSQKQKMELLNEVIRETKAIILHYYSLHNE